jgi:hypothetical protein
MALSLVIFTKLLNLIIDWFLLVPCHDLWFPEKSSIFCTASSCLWLNEVQGTPAYWSHFGNLSSVNDMSVGFSLLISVYFMLKTSLAPMSRSGTCLGAFKYHQCLWFVMHFRQLIRGMCIFLVRGRFPILMMCCLQLLDRGNSLERLNRLFSVKSQKAEKYHLLLPWFHTECCPPLLADPHF